MFAASLASRPVTPGLANTMGVGPDDIILRGRVPKKRRKRRTAADGRSTSDNPAHNLGAWVSATDTAKLSTDVVFGLPSAESAGSSVIGGLGVSPIAQLNTKLDDLTTLKGTFTAGSDALQGMLGDLHKLGDDDAAAARDDTLNDAAAAERRAQRAALGAALSAEIVLTTKRVAGISSAAVAAVNELEASTSDMWSQCHDWIAQLLQNGTQPCHVVLSMGLQFFSSSVCTCAKRTGAATSVERRRREPARGDLAGVTRARQRQSCSCTLLSQQPNMLDF
jgi:hypothetical protein